MQQEHVVVDRRRPENENFRLAVDMRDPFLLPADELAQLADEAPTTETRGWLRGISEARKLTQAVGR